MSFSGSRIKSRFLCGEQAPSPLEVVNGGILIPNHLGNLALRIPELTPDASGGAFTLDTTVEPPELRFVRANVEVQFGQPDPQGNFVQFDHELPSGRHMISGVYTGPGSELSVS